MKIKSICMAVFLLSNSAMGLEFCPNEQAREDGGYLKSIEVCDYETVETNLRTTCHYSGKLWGSLGGVIFQNSTIEIGHNSCAGSTYLSQTICGYPTPPTLPLPPESLPNYPSDPDQPEQICDDYSGNVPLVSQVYSSDTVSQEIPGSCHISRVWVSCKP